MIHTHTHTHAYANASGFWQKRSRYVLSNPFYGRTIYILTTSFQHRLFKPCIRSAYFFVCVVFLLLRFFFSFSPHFFAISCAYTFTKHIRGVTVAWETWPGVLVAQPSLHWLEFVEPSRRTRNAEFITRRIISQLIVPVLNFAKNKQNKKHTR